MSVSKCKKSFLLMGAAALVSTGVIPATTASAEDGTGTFIMRARLIGYQMTAVLI